MPPYTRDRLEKGWFSNLQNLISLVAFHNDRIVGHAQILKFSHPRRKGTGDLLIYLHQDFHNAGLGTALLGELLKLARKEDMHRISIHVVADNKPALHLYGKFGFDIEGVMKDSYFGDDERYHDEVVMGLVLK